MPPKGITFCPEPEKFRKPIIIPPACVIGAAILAKRPICPLFAKVTKPNLFVFSLFEILLTVYVEMIFNHYKMQYLEFHAEEDNFDDKFDNFKLDLSQINLAMLTDNFDEKIKKLKFILNINEISFERYEECKINRYCTVLFKDLLRDKAFFIMNSDQSA